VSTPPAIPHAPTRPRTAAAFTLIELLVVISIIGILISIAVPALSRARRSGDQVRESAALKQVCLAYTAYSQDNRSALLPGYAMEEWVTPGAARELHVSYADSPGCRLYGSVARRYTWRLAPYLGYARDALVSDKRLRAEFNALPDSPAARDGFQWAYGSSPSFGINSTWVGGDSRRGGFFQPALTRWGKFYITRIDEPRFADKLMIFATSRGYHPLTGSGTTVIPGRHRIEGPWRASREPNQVPTFSPWEAPPGDFDSSRSPSTYGHLDFRHFRRVLVTTFDGHVAALRMDDMRDMRRWANQATSANWQPQ
jgi:prepilin-type N-terminal cleavage/methylation domain-containing protein